MDEETDKSLLDELEEDLDDVGMIKRQYMSKILAEDDEFNSSQVPVDTITRREVMDLIENLPKPMIQKPFQPGSSPLEDSNRFLCWNSVGIIRAQNTEDDQGIDVLFHDSEKNIGVNFKNEANYSFGSMSEDVIVVATNGKYGTGPASIHGIDLLESDRDHRDWNIDLPPAEIIQGLAVGSGFVAVATDDQYLRLFTAGGMQSYVFSLHSQILCMTAQDKQLMLIMHSGAGHQDEQNLYMTVYHIDLMKDQIKQTLSEIPVALSKRSPLAWIGFTDEGSPCTFDYREILRLYRHDLGRSWVPLLDMRELTSSALDHYFLIGISEIGQSVRAVKCRRSRYPDFHSETAEVLDLSLPMCEMDLPKGQFEEKHVRLRLAESSLKRLAKVENLKLVAEVAQEANEKLLVNTILQLFAIYLKDEKTELAKNLVYMMPKDHMSKLAEYAWKTGRRQHFIDSLNRTIEERDQSEYELRSSDKDDLISVSSETSVHHFGQDLRRELARKSKPIRPVEEEASLRPIGIEKLSEESHRVKQKLGSLTNQCETLDDSEDEENIAKPAHKKIKTVNYNVFSKKRPKMTTN